MMRSSKREAILLGMNNGLSTAISSFQEICSARLRLSSKFDDVGENGKISRAALQRPERDQPQVVQPSHTAEEEAA